VEKCAEDPREQTNKEKMQKKGGGQSPLRQKMHGQGKTKKPKHTSENQKKTTKRGRRKKEGGRANPDQAKRPMDVNGVSPFWGWGLGARDTHTTYVEVGGLKKHMKRGGGGT